MLYKDTKVIVGSPDGDTDFFDNVTIVLQGDYSDIVASHRLHIGTISIHDMTRLYCTNINRYNERECLVGGDFQHINH